MTYTISKPTIKRIYRGQPGFNIIDGVKIVPRAEFEILEQCPHHVRDTVAWAIAKGWVQPVANVRDDELVWDKLTNNP
jgi:hypothetical protein